MPTHSIPEIDAAIWEFGWRMAQLARTCEEAGTALHGFSKTVRRSAASSVRALSREQRQKYWTLRQAGMPPFDALAARTKKQQKGNSVQ